MRATEEAGFDRGNRVGTQALARCIGRMAPSARLVVVSSLAAAGPSPTPDGMAPGDPPAPISSYGRSKLAAERASLEAARLNLERTRLNAPFNGRVVAEAIDIGQYVTPGQSLATLQSTEAAEIVIPLADADLCRCCPGSPCMQALH